MTLTHSGASELGQLMEGTTAGALIPEIVRRGFQDLLEAEVSALTGAQLHERCPDQRSTHRNGYRERLLTTQVGDLTLAIPKLRQGSFFPNWLEPRRRVDKALYAVVMEAYTGGISTRKVDALVEALGGASGISKSEVSRICQGLDEQVKAFLQRPLDHARFPYVYLDATYLHGRLGRNMQVVSRAVVVAIGINALGYREVLGIAVGDSEAEGFWRQFLSSLKERGLTGTRLVISDAHLGLTAAIKRMFQGCCWQRCRVHFLRNLLSHVPKAGQDMVAAAMKAVFVIQAPDQTGSGARPLAAGHRDAAQAVPRRCARDGSRPRRRAGVPALPTGALAQDLEHQPARALEQGDQATHQRGRHLPQRRRDHPLGGQPAAGAAGGMAAGAPAFLLRGHHGQDPGARRGPGAHRS